MSGNLHHVEKDWEYKGYRCIVVFQISGFRCGYVELHKSDKLYGIDFYDALCNITCHGGITYSESYLNAVESTNTWWIGFDCNHMLDAKDFDTAFEYWKDDPERLRTLEYFKMAHTGLFGSDTVKDLDYCIEECESIVDQIIKLNETIKDVTT